MNMSRLIGVWNNFWFEQVSPAPVCLYRIFFGLLMIATGLVWFAELDTYFGVRGWLTIETAKRLAPGGERFSLFFLLPQTSETVVVLFALYMLFAIAVTVGFYTRISLIIFYILLMSFQFRDFLILNGGDTILRVSCFLLILSPCGKMFSFDARRKSFKEQWEIKDFIWVQRLLQLEITAIYFQTMVAKIQGEVWHNGTAVYYVSRNEAFAKFPVPFLFDQLWTCQLLSWGTLLIETAMFSLVWVPKLRYPVLLAGFLLHLGIDWSMNILFFQNVMMALYINFVRADDIKKYLEWLMRRISGVRQARVQAEQS